MSFSMWLCVATSLRADPLVLTSQHNRYDAFTHYVQYYDPSGEESLAEVYARFAAGAFQPFPGPQTRMAFRSGAVWLSLDIRNEGHLNDTWLLAFSDLVANAIDVSVMDHGAVVESQRVGADTPKAEQPLHHRVPLARLTLAPGAQTQILIRIKSRFQLDTAMTLQTAAEFYESEDSTNVFYGTYFSVCFAMLIYNLFLYLALRFRTYLDYVAFISTMMLFVFARSGISNYLAPDWWPHHLSLMEIYRALPLITSIVFARTFLETKKLIPRGDLFLRVMMYLAWASILLGYSPLLGIAGVLSDLVMLIISSGFIVIAAIAYRRGHRPAMYYLISWTIMLSLVIIWTAARYAAVPMPFFIRFAPLIGQMIEMIVISLGLGDHINTLVAGMKVAEIKAAESEKNRTLLRVISHDLGNPLSVIQNYAAMHLKPAAGQQLDSRRSWERVLEAANHQQAIIEHVREMDSLTSGKKQIELNPVSIDDALVQIDHIFGKKLEEKGIKLAITKPRDPVFVLAEARSLQYTVMNNLISNAMKFSPPYSVITLAIAVIGDRVTISVTDQGVGIPQAAMAGLFDPFKPTSRRGTSGEKGTGFGLPIVKSYVDLYGGTITVTSQTADASPTAHGTTMTVMLRRGQATPALKTG